MTQSGLAQLVLVTGPSGAGRSTAINTLEDLGFEAIDNLPLRLVPRLLEGPGPDRPLEPRVVEPDLREAAQRWKAGTGGERHDGERQDQLERHGRASAATGQPDDSDLDLIASSRVRAV